jgi:hypothetical protein
MSNVTLHPIICCPSCGAKIEIAAKEVQTELPLGPIEVSYPVNRLIENTKRIESVNRNQTRIEPSRLIASNEEDLFGTLQEILGDLEIIRNGGLWRWRIRDCKRAIEYAIEDWKLRTPDQRCVVKNRPAWLTDRYKRACHEIEKARKIAELPIAMGGKPLP